MRDDEGHGRPDAGSADEPDTAQIAQRPPIHLPVLDEASKGLEPPPKTPITKKPIFWIGIVLVLAALVAAFLYWRHSRQFETTDDAFVDAHIVRLAPQVAGVLQTINAPDNAHVVPGQVLAVIEPSGPTASLNTARANLLQSEAALAQAEAQREQQRANVTAARATARQQQANIGVPAADRVRAGRDLARYLEAKQANAAAVANITIDQARASVQQAGAQLNAAAAQASNAGANIVVAERQVRAAEANVTAARAAVAANRARVDSALVTIGNLKLTAPVAGHIASRTVNVGSYVAPGTQVLAIVPDQIWVTANFKETQLSDMRIGQHVDIKVDALPNTKFEGHIDSFQRGAGQAFQLLPAENATGNYVKVVQRVPVRIVFDLDHGKPNPLNYPVGPGMSVSPRVKVR